MSPSQAKEQVLLVVTEPCVSDFLAKCIARNGYEVITTENGLEALMCCCNQPVPVIVTDMNMPVMDGLELITTVKNQFPLTKVIAMSSDDMLLEKASELGASIIQKPIRQNELIALIQNTFTSELD